MLALRGEGRHELARALLRSPKAGPFRAPLDSMPRLAQLVIDDELLDQVLVLDRPESRQLEIHLHASDALLSVLRQHLEIDTLQLSPAESLLCQALDGAQVELALEQLAQPWSAFLAGLAGSSPEQRSREIAAARERSRAAMAMAQPARLVLCGAQNAGKSTLMNRLLASPRSLTGAFAGLTRDPVRDQTCLSGYPYLLVDTAGEGPAQTEIDRRAQGLGRRELAEGDIRLLLVDGSCQPSREDRALAIPPCLLLRSKGDLIAAHWPEDFSAHLEISARDQSASELRVLIGASLLQLRSLPPAGPVGGPAALSREELTELAEE